MKHAISFFAVMALLLTGEHVLSQDTERVAEVNKFKKCYLMFVRYQAPDDHPYIADISSGRTSANDACLKLIENADISKGTLSMENVEAVAVLKTFNDLHRSWFSSLDLNMSLEQTNGNPSAAIHDINESAYYYTYALFNPSFTFRETLTSDRPLVAKRYSELNGDYNPNRTLFVPRKVTRETGYYRGYMFSPTLRFATPEENYALAENPPIAEVGYLTGLEIYEDEFTPPLIYSTWPVIRVVDGKKVSEDEGEVNGWYGNKDQEEVTNIKQHHGGGILGTQSHLMLNLGLKPTTDRVGIPKTFDGAFHLSRRWSKAVFNELLCRDIPVVRPRDAAPYLNLNSNLPFRKGLTCMGCHASMDPLAKIVGNMIVSQSSRYTGITAHMNGGPFVDIHVQMYHVAPNKVDESLASTLEQWPDEDKDFRWRSPHGKFYFRTHDGELVSKELKNLSDLGAAISSTDDYYICAARKYLLFMTGIKAEIFDQGDFTAPSLNKRQTAHQNFVIKLGKELKEHQNIRKTIRDIIASPYFVKPGLEE